MGGFGWLKCVKKNQCMLLLGESVWRGWKQKGSAQAWQDNGKGRARHADGEGTSQGNDLKPHYEPQMEMEEQVEGDVEQQVGMEPEAQQLDNYPVEPESCIMFTWPR